MKRIIILLMALFLVACNQPKEVETNIEESEAEQDIDTSFNEKDLFHGIRENSYGKNRASVIDSEDEYILISVNGLEINIPKDTPFLNLEDFSSEGYDFKEGDDIVVFIKEGTPILTSNPPIINPKLIVREYGGYEAELDRFHLVDNYILSTNNRIKSAYNVAISANQAWNLNGKPLHDRPEIKDYIIIYKGTQEGTPPLALSQTIIDIPDEGEIIFGKDFKNFMQSRSIFLKRQDFLNGMNNPSRFFSRDYEYFAIRETFENSGMSVLWDADRKVIEVKNRNEKIIINPQTKKFTYKGEEREIISIVPHDGSLYAPREFFEEAIECLIKE